MAHKEKLAKTNAMRELERGGVAYEAQTYEDDGSLATGYGLHVAEALGEDPDTAFKINYSGLDVFGVLQNNDAYNALKAVDGLVFTGPTGTNVNDVAVALYHAAE